MILEDIITSPGKKIKLIRKSLKLRQEELTAGKISRNLISYIENDKIKLMPDTAHIIAENINTIAKEKNLNIYIDADYLLENEVEQSRRILIKSMKNLEKYVQIDKIAFKSELERAENIIGNWPVLDIGANIYRLAGEYYYNKGEYNQSYLYYMKALENQIREWKPHEVVETILNLGKCFLKLEYYNEAISLNNYALSILKQNDIVDLNINKRVFFNNALAYKNQKYFDKCLYEIDKLEQCELNLYQKLETTLLKGNCYLSKKDYDIALNLYRKILDQVKENNDFEYPDLIAKIYNNIGDIHLIEGDIYKSKDYKLKAFNIAKKGNVRTLLLVLISLADICIKIGEYDLVENHLLKYKNETKNSNSILRLEIYAKLMEIYFNNNDIQSLDEIFKEIQLITQEYSERDILQKIEKLYFLASYYYIDIDKNKSKEYLKFGLDIQNIYN